MKKTTNYRHRIFYLLICIVFFSSLLSLMPKDSVKAADTSFTFKLTKPVNNVFVSGPTVSFSGTYTLDSTTTGTSLSVTVTDITDPNNPAEITAPGVLMDSDNSWSFNKDDFSPGFHKVKFTGTDGTTTISVESSFTVGTSRPTVKSLTLVSDKVENGNAWGNSIVEDMTHVPLNAKIQLTVKSNNQIEYTKAEDGTYNNPIKVKTASGTIVNSNEDGTAPPQVNDDGNYVITFTPNKELMPNTTYYVEVSKNITDQNGIAVYPTTLKFTTASNNDTVNPHGKYFDTGDNSRSNLCSTCHSTHKGADSALMGGNFIKDPTKDPTDTNTVNYCMACHDGTSATKTNNMNNPDGSVHDEKIDTKHMANEGSCSTCHDPHEVWSQDNPNLFKGHYTYTHDSGNGEPTGVIDSFTQPCENCHSYPTSTVDGKNYYSAKDAKAQTDLGVQYNFLHYRGSLTRVGNSTNNILQDSDLCLRCHNGSMKQDNKVTSDIQTYYSDTSSKHNFATLDGSNITGPFTCSICHDTHGSGNSLLLKSKLGDDYQDGTFSVTGTTILSADKEREFCLKCHNGSTEVYGVTGQALDTSKSSGHLSTSTNACSSCHGTGSTSAEKALSAAHAPKLPAGSSSSSSSLIMSSRVKSNTASTGLSSESKTASDTGTKVDTATSTDITSSDPTSPNAESKTSINSTESTDSNTSEDSKLSSDSETSTTITGP